MAYRVHSQCLHHSTEGNKWSLLSLNHTKNIYCLILKNTLKYSCLTKGFIQPAVCWKWNNCTHIERLYDWKMRFKIWNLYVWIEIKFTILFTRINCSKNYLEGEKKNSKQTNKKKPRLWAKAYLHKQIQVKLSLCSVLPMLWAGHIGASS